jgi:crossover junction endodeoxyribonuclease RusA
VTPIAFELPWPLSVNHYWGRKGHQTFVSARGLAYRKEILAIIRNAKIFKPLEGRMHVVLRLYPPTRREHDVDNGLKCLLDALQHGGLLKNDSQIKKLDIEMYDLPEDPTLGIVEFYMQPMGPRETLPIHTNTSQ